MLQPLTARYVDLTKPVVSKGKVMGDVYFNGFSWKFVCATVDFVIATQDCTDYVRKESKIIAPDGQVWDVIDYEKANAKEYDPTKLFF